MRIADARLRRVSGRLRSPVSNSGATWTSREGLLLQLISDGGQVGQGEASPLPGYSDETLAQCEQGLSALLRDPRRELNLARPATDAVRAWLEPHRLPPAARFAAETALLDLIGAVTDRPFADYLQGSTSPHAVAVAALLPLTTTEGLLAAADAARERGIGTFKIKIGAPGAFERELGSLRALRKHVGSEIAIRLDANGAFPIDVARARLDALAELSPELLEEPVAPGQWAALGELGPPPFPLAADESLARPELRAALGRAFAAGTLTIAVLKPTLLGGVLACLDRAAELRPHAVRFTVTHAWEGPVALAAAAALACVLPQAELAAGLDRHPGLSLWPAVPWLLGEAELRPGRAPGLGLPELALP